MPVGMSLSLVIATAVLDSIGWRSLWFLNAGLILLYALVFGWLTAPRRWHPLADAGTVGDGTDGRANPRRVLDFLKMTDNVAPRPAPG